MLSAGGPGSGAMWHMRGIGERRALQSGHFREAMRLRLGIATAPHEATCKLCTRQHADTHAMVCGQALRDDDGLCTHPLVCDAAAARLRPHRAVSTAIGRALRAAGAEVDYERHIPHLYQWDEEKQRYREAILDVVAVWPGDSVLRCWDVTIACPHAQRVAKAAEVPGAAVTSAERRKHDRYGADVRPFGLETYGRMGVKSMSMLWEAAREASLYGRATASAAALQSRWRADADLALCYSQADAMLASKGALQHVAGAAYFPVGRMVKRTTAAGGEHRQGPC